MRFVVLILLLGLGWLPAQAQTREQAAASLRGLAKALDAKDWSKAVSYFYLPPGLDPAKAQTLMPRMVEKKEISSAGVEILIKKGKWGGLAEVFGQKRAEGWATRNKIPLKSCYGLGLDPAEAGFYWNGKSLKLIRLDDLGKLQ